MTDLTPILNELLKSHDAPPTTDPSLSFQKIDEFLKEAYRINSHIAALNTNLRGIRQSYLSTAPPSRRLKLASADKQWKYLTDHDRAQIDADTQSMVRELNASIRTLEDAEQVRQDTETVLRNKKYARLGLGALGAWAAGGAGQTKSHEQELDEVRANTISAHRDSVLLYLRRKLEACGNFHKEMAEKRFIRQMEKNKSMLATSQRPLPDFSGLDSMPLPVPKRSTSSAAHLEAQYSYPEEEPTPEQLQEFEKQNEDMLKHYESTLDQVKTTEKSLIEISELQTQLVSNLETQSAHIDQLVADSFLTTENVGGGNKQLKKAAERKSTAKYVFYASCGLSAFLIVWDLII